MTFASDLKGEVGKTYGAYLEKNNMDNRLLYVVGPDGKITYTAKPFKAFVADAYPELGAAVKKASGAK
jgi:peroxiredoxin